MLVYCRLLFVILWFDANLSTIIIICKQNGANSSRYDTMCVICVSFCVP